MNLLKEYNFYKKEIQDRKQEFLKTKNDKQKIFKELCFCILTPQSKAINCWSAVEELFMKGFPRCSMKTVEKVLHSKVRFYKNKTKYLFELVNKFDFIYKIINANFEPKILRKILVKEVKGLGLKEASHFLRNIGYSFDLAILDRHILKNLRRFRVIKSIPKTLTMKNYLAIEQRFIDFSKKVKIPIVDLDLLFWARQVGFVFK